MCEGKARKVLFSDASFVHTHTTFYGTSISEVIFDETFRISDLKKLEFGLTFKFWWLDRKTYINLCDFLLTFRI